MSHSKDTLKLIINIINNLDRNNVVYDNYFKKLSKKFNISSASSLDSHINNIVKEHEILFSYFGIYPGDRYLKDIRMRDY